MENIYKIIELNYKKNDIINNINKKIEEKKGEIENCISKIKKKKLIFNYYLKKEFIKNLIE